MRSEKRSPASSSPKRRSGRLLRVALVGLAAITLMGGECDPKGPDFFNPFGSLDPLTGDIVGQVTVDGIARAGVTVTLRQGNTVIATRTTDTNGEYDFRGVATGTFTVSVGSVDGASCPEDQTATVLADQTTDVNFACTSQPTTGTVTGTVTADGSPVSGATVALDGMTTTTDANGMFTFTDVTPGTYSLTVTLTGVQCGPQTTMLAAGGTVTVTVTCTVTPPTGSEIAAVSYSLMATIVGTDECGLGMTISNPGPIPFDFDPATNTLTGRSNTNAPGILVPGQPWTGSGETTTSSGTMTFTLRETIMGTWVRQGGLITLTGTLLFEFFDGSSQVCESRYDATYQEIAASSARFKRDVLYLLPEGLSILGLRPVGFRYHAAYGDPEVPRLGLIAEDVVGVFPGAVALDPAGRPVGIAYGILRTLVVEKAASQIGRALDVAIGRLLGTG